VIIYLLIIIRIYKIIENPAGCGTKDCECCDGCKQCRGCECPEGKCKCPNCKIGSKKIFHTTI